MSNGQMEIVTLGSLILEEGKQNRCHFDVQDLVTKFGMVFWVSSYKQIWGTHEE